MPPKRRFKASKTLSGIETYQNDVQPVKRSLGASKPLKPFQGLKQKESYSDLGLSITGFKASKTLSGIETNWLCWGATKDYSFKASKTLSGIETVAYAGLAVGALSALGFKASKTLSGIET